MTQENGWYVAQNGVSVGPMTRVALESMIYSGALSPGTLVWPGHGEWVAAATTELAMAFRGQMASGPPPLPGIPGSNMSHGAARWPRIGIIVGSLVLGVSLLIPLLNGPRSSWSEMMVGIVPGAVLLLVSLVAQNSRQ